MREKNPQFRPSNNYYGSNPHFKSRNDHRYVYDSLIYEFD